MRRKCPHESARPAYNIQEAEIVGQVARVVPRIYVALEAFQEDHQSTPIEVAGNIVEKYISILIESGSNHHYIAPRVVEFCALRK